MSSEFGKFPAKGLILPDILSRKSKLQVGECKVEFKLSGENSKCPAKDWSFAGQNVQQGSDQFRILCKNWEEASSKKYLYTTSPVWSYFRLQEESQNVPPGTVIANRTSAKPDR